ncbi:MAG: hypothetical protein M3151_03490 [Actinomycetota bacterium]|nr:hypothetical protein [Actinomycetota bacterium]
MTTPETDKEKKERELIRELARKGKLRTRGSGRIPDDFWDMPRPKDPEGLARRYLIEDRRQGR